MNLLCRSVVIFVLAGVLAAGLAAQTTWIVDSAGGAGAHFTDLPPALAAARDGDTILVRQGSYYGGSTGKALRLMALGPASLFLGLTVTGLPHGGQFVLAGGFWFYALVPGAQLRFHANAGTVHVESLGGSGSSPGPVEVHDCALVTFTRCALDGVDIRRSAVVFTASTASGEYVDINGGRLPLPALAALDSNLVVADCRIMGADALPCGRFCSTASTVGMRMSNCRLRVDGRTSIRGGLTDNYERIARAGIEAYGCVIELDPLAVVSGASGAPPFVGSPAPVVRPVPGLSARGAPPGGAVRAEVTAEAGAPAVVVAGLPMRLLPTPFGELGLDPAAVAIVASGAIPSFGPWQVTVPVPGAAGLGTPIALQALVVTTVAVELTTSAVILLR